MYHQSLSIDEFNNSDKIVNTEILFGVSDKTNYRKSIVMTVDLAIDNLLYYTKAYAERERDSEITVFDTFSEALDYFNEI